MGIAITISLLAAAAIIKIVVVGHIQYVHDIKEVKGYESGYETA